jgi:hypothetical protein
MITCALCIARLSQVASSTTRHKSFDLSEAVPSTEDVPVLQERRSQKAFATMLAKIVEDEALDEGDRTIGDYTIDDEQWLEWKRGGRAPSPVDEYESDESDGMATTMTAGSEATCSKSASIRSGNDRVPSSFSPSYEAVPRRKAAKGKRMMTDVEDTN